LHIILATITTFISTEEWDTACNSLGVLLWVCGEVQKTGKRYFVQMKKVKKKKRLCNRPMKEK
jgi:hypothetical protein